MRLFVGILPAHLWQILLRHLQSDAKLRSKAEVKNGQEWPRMAKISKMDSFRFLWIPWNTFVVWETATLRLLLCRSTRMGQMEVERQVKDRAEELQVAQSSRSMCGKYLPHPSTFYRNLLSTNCYEPGLNQTGQHTVPSAVLFLGPSGCQIVHLCELWLHHFAEQLQRQWSQHRQRLEEPMVSRSEWHAKSVFSYVFL